MTVSIIIFAHTLFAAFVMTVKALLEARARRRVIREVADIARGA